MFNEPVYRRSDFEFTPTSVRCINPDLWFERPSRLTKYDIACVLQSLCGVHSCWTVFYDAYKYSGLVVRLNDAFEKYATC